MKRDTETQEVGVGIVKMSDFDAHTRNVLISLFGYREVDTHSIAQVLGISISQVSRYVANGTLIPSNEGERGTRKFRIVDVIYPGIEELKKKNRFINKHQVKTK